jgi:hypothetical protein
MPEDLDGKSSANKKIRKENRHGADIPGKLCKFENKSVPQGEGANT